MTRNSVQQSKQTADEKAGSGIVLMLTPPEAAKALAISERKLWEMTDNGEIPCRRAGRAVRYPLTVLQEWIERGLTKPAA